MSFFTNNDFVFSSAHDLSCIDDLPVWSAPFGLQLLDTVIFKKNINIVDIGCGSGFPLIELAQRFGNTCKLFGIDPWQHAIDRCLQKKKFLKLENVELFQCFAEKLPFEDCIADLIVSNNGMNNVQSLTTAIGECSRISKKGAQFVQTMNLDKTMSEFYDVFKEVLVDSGLSYLTPKINEHIYSKRKPLTEVCNLLNNQGFNVESCNTHQFEIKYSDGTAMFQSPFIRYAFFENWLNIVPVESNKIIFDKVCSKLNKIAEESGCLKLTIPFAVINSFKV